MKQRTRFARVSSWDIVLRLALPGSAACLEDTQGAAAELAWRSLAQFTLLRPCPRLAKRATALPRSIFWILTASARFSLSTESSVGQTWTTVTNAPSANWVSLASSADGNTVAALEQGGEVVYLSTNAGLNWTLSSPGNGALGTGIACSADGKILYSVGTTQVYASTNAGASWNPTFSPFASWTGVACSADGTHIASSSAFRRGSPDGVITSPDGGATWNANTPPADAFLAVASSADGIKLAGVDQLAASVYTSDDGGNSWAPHSPPLQEFTALACSADGTRLVVTSQGNGSGGPVFISTNSGLNWAPTTAPVTNWVAIASSADGRTLLAASGGSGALGHLFLSTDSGTTWNVTNSLHTHWSAVAVSADGTKLVAAENTGHIYTLHLSPVNVSPALEILRSGANAIVSWLVPSMDFTLQQNTDLTSSNWVNVSTAPVLNMANLNNEVTVPNPLGSAYFRLSAAGAGGISGVQAFANVLHGPWEALVVNTIFTPTFNADHTFTAMIQSPSGVITTDSGTWSLGPPLTPNSFANPQAHLPLTNALGNDLLSGDVLLLNADQLVFLSATTTLEPISPVVNVVLSKMTP